MSTKLTEVEQILVYDQTEDGFNDRGVSESCGIHALFQALGYLQFSDTTKRNHFLNNENSFKEFYGEARKAINIKQIDGNDITTVTQRELVKKFFNSQLDHVFSKQKISNLEAIQDNLPSVSVIEMDLEEGKGIGAGGEESALSDIVKIYQLKQYLEKGNKPFKHSFIVGIDNRHWITLVVEKDEKGNIKWSGMDSYKNQIDNFEPAKNAIQNFMNSLNEAKIYEIYSHFTGSINNLYQQIFDQNNTINPEIEVLTNKEKKRMPTNEYLLREETLKITLNNIMDIYNFFEKMELLNNDFYSNDVGKLKALVNFYHQRFTNDSKEILNNNVKNIGKDYNSLKSIFDNMSKRLNITSNTKNLDKSSSKNISIPKPESIHSETKIVAELITEVQDHIFEFLVNANYDKNNSLLEKSEINWSKINKNKLELFDNNDKNQILFKILEKDTSGTLKEGIECLVELNKLDKNSPVTISGDILNEITYFKLIKEGVQRSKAGTQSNIDTTLKSNNQNKTTFQSVVQTSEKTPLKTEGFDPAKRCKTSGWCNNCGLNCFAHFLAEKIQSDEISSRENYPNYQEFLKSFKEYYNLVNDVSFKDIKKILDKNSNPLDHEAILAPVLRWHLGKDNVLWGPEESWNGNVDKADPLERFDGVKGSFRVFLESGRNNSDAFISGNITMLEQVRYNCEKEIEEKLKSNPTKKEIQDTINELLQRYQHNNWPLYLSVFNNESSTDGVDKAFNNTPTESSDFVYNKIKALKNKNEFNFDAIEKIKNGIIYEEIQRKWRNEIIEKHLDEMYKFWIEKGHKNYKDQIRNIANREMISAQELGKLGENLGIDIAVHSLMTQKNIDGTTDSFFSKDPTFQVVNDQIGSKWKMKFCNEGRDHWEYEANSVDAAKQHNLFYGKGNRMFGIIVNNRSAQGDRIEGIKKEVVVALGMVNVKTPNIKIETAESKRLSQAERAAALQTSNQSPASSPVLPSGGVKDKPFKERFKEKVSNIRAKGIFDPNINKELYNSFIEEVKKAQSFSTHELHGVIVVDGSTHNKAIFKKPRNDGSGREDTAIREVKGSDLTGTVNSDAKEDFMETFAQSLSGTNRPIVMQPYKGKDDLDACEKILKSMQAFKNAMVDLSIGEDNIKLFIKIDNDNVKEKFIKLLSNEDRKKYDELINNVSTMRFRS